MSDNPLASGMMPQKPDPVRRHAELWQHAQTLPQDQLQEHVQFMDYALPIMGALASDPNVKAKDVIKALSNAVADGKMEPSKAVSNLMGMPADPEQLRPWLKARYADSLAMTVHAKAALLQQEAVMAQGGPVAAGPSPAGPAAAGAAPTAPAPVQA